ncbi:MAG: hypothetical protein HY854_25790 [Burkholderiales bacterium]|nr:hypothetical protein [Burkholderiales bacterium]
MTKPETVLLAAVAAFIALALLGPAVPNPADPHGFADQRALWGVPYAMDVLSNLPFALAALAGGAWLWRIRHAVSTVQVALSALFFAGLAATAAGSAWYHLRPDDAGLAVDRYAMSIAFAGLLGLAAAGRAGERAGLALGISLLVLAPASVAVWSATGNVLPWAVVQFGGMAGVLACAFTRPLPGGLPVRWLLVLAAYGVAKLFEANDHAIYELTGHALSGHTLKHLAAACAAWPLIASVQNARAAAAAPREMA